MCIEYHIYVNLYYVSAQGVDERMLNVHYYYREQWVFSEAEKSRALVAIVKRLGLVSR